MNSLEDAKPVPRWRSGVMRPLALALVMAMLASGLLGCARLKPWERGVLAREDMAWDPDPLRSRMRGHIFFSKEGSMPATGGGGGGCGCN